MICKCCGLDVRDYEGVGGLDNEVCGYCVIWIEELGFDWIFGVS